MPRARARLSPASRRSARLWLAAAMVAHEDTITRDGDDRQAAHSPACAGRARAAARGPARAPAVHAGARDAEPQVRPPDRALGVAEAALARASADRRAVLHRAGGQAGDR